MNLGIVTGRESGLLVLDVDPRNDGDESLWELERKYGELPCTVRSHSGGGGQHIFFACHQRIPSFELVPGVEVKAEGTLIVAPPSVHPSGHGYEWDVDGHPDDAPLADLPKWVRDQCAPRERRRPRPVTLEAIRQGSRNATLTRLAGRMRLVGTPEEGVRAALTAVNRDRCHPPLGDKEVEAIARSALRWGGLPWLTAPREFFTDERLLPTARFVLQAICWHTNHEGEAWPSYETLRVRTGIKSDATIKRAIDELAAADRISVTRRNRNSNIYFVTRFPSARKAAPPSEPLVLSPQRLKKAGDARFGALAA